MAAARVLDTVELLEMVILELPIRDVFVNQRVSRRWQSTITDSVKLRQALFLKPSTLVESDITSKTATFTLDSSCRDILAAPGRKTVLPSVLSISNNCGTLSDIKEVASASAMGYQEASWRKMLICQPPMDRMAFLTNYRDSMSRTLIGHEGPELPGVETMFGASFRQGDFEQIVTVEAKPHVGILTFAQAIPEYLRQHNLARHKGQELHMAAGDEEELAHARTSFVWEMAKESFRRLRVLRQPILPS